MQQFSVKDAAILTGVNAPMLRQWEKRYSLLPPLPARTQRIYTQKQLFTVLRIMFLHHHGLRLPQIASLNDEEFRQVVEHALPNRDSYAHFSLLLAEAALQFNERSFVLLLQKLHRYIGIEYLVEHVYNPLLQRLQAVWPMVNLQGANTIFAFNLVQRHVSIAIAQLPLPVYPPQILLFGAKHQANNLSLLHAQYILHSGGFAVMPLGSDVHPDVLVKVNEQLNVPYLFMHLPHLPLQLDADTYLEKLVQLFPTKKIVAFGDGITGVQRNFLQVQLLPNAAALALFKNI